MKKYLLVIVLVILQICSVGCKSSDIKELPTYKPKVPIFVREDGESRAKYIDGTEYVILDYDLWKEIFLYIVKTQDELDITMPTEAIKNAVIDVNDLSDFVRKSTEK